MEEIFKALGHRQDWSQATMIGLLMIMRIVPVTFITPFLGGKLVPPETKMGLSFGLTIFSFSYATGYMHGPMVIEPFAYLVLMLKELFIGFTLGFVATELFYAMDIAGRVLDIMRGSNMAEVQVPELGTRASPMGDYAFQLLLVLFFLINGHMIFIEAMVTSFKVIPIDAWPTTFARFDELVSQVMHFSGSLFSIAFSLVFPGLFAVFMVDVIFGMLNRVAPQLNAYQMAMGIKTLAGIAFFLLALSLMIPQLIHRAQASLDLVQRVIFLFGAG